MKILVIGPSWVGDMVMAQSLFIALKQRDPDADIHVLAPAWCKALLGHMPEVTSAIEMTVGHGELGLSKRRALAKKLRMENFAQAIILPNSFKSALIPWFAGIPLRTGWRGEARSWLLNDCRVLDKKTYPLMVERFVALAFPAGAALPAPLPRPAMSINKQSRDVTLQKFSLKRATPVLVLCPGAEFGEAKKWPAGSYAEVASNWLENNGQVWILGSAKDGESAKGILSVVGQSHHDLCKDLTGQTTLSEVIELMSCADRVVSNDSGLMHIAAALDRLLVVVYGSTSPAFTPPLAQQVKIVSLDLDCSPCFKRTCPLGHTNCLKQLDPDKVILALAQLQEMGK